MLRNTWPLQRTLAVAFTSVAVIAVLPISVLNVLDTRALLHQRAHDRLARHASATVTRLDDTVADLVQWARELETHPQVLSVFGDDVDTEPDTDAWAPGFLDRLRDAQSLSAAFVADTAGQVRASSGNAHPPSALADWPAFAAAQGGQAVVTVEGIGTPEAAIFVLAPLRLSGRVRGVLAFEEDFDSVRARIHADDEAVGANSFGVLREANGRVLVHGERPALEGGTDPGTEDAFAVSTSLRRAPWSYTLAVPRAWVDGPIEAQIHRVIMATLALLVLAGLLSWALARAVAGPFAQLERTAAAWASGDRTARTHELDGAEARRLGVAFDRMATEISRHEAELEAEVTSRTADLAVANQELELFTYSASHDLRAPLRIIDGYAAALLEDYGERVDPEGRVMLERLVTTAERMQRLIEDLLEFGRVSRLALKREVVDVSALVREIGAELATAFPDRAVRLDVSDGLTVLADPALLRVVMVNLLDNAWKYTGRREEAHIEVSREGAALRVRDDGAGFDPAHAARLFAPFARLHSAHEFPGTGIGLATVARIVQRHGGDIRAESTVGGGATFRFTLGNGDGSGRPVGDG